MRTSDKVNKIIDELENQEAQAPEINDSLQAQDIANEIIKKYGCEKVELDTGTLINPDDSAISEPLNAVNGKYLIDYSVKIPPTKNILKRTKRFILRKLRGTNINHIDIINQQNEVNSYLLATINAMNARRGQYESEFSRINEEIKKREEEIYLLKSQIAVLSDRINQMEKKV